MPYTAEKPPLATSTEELRNRIPGWGVDLNPHDRPSVPKERFDPKLNGAHWEFPERQPERWSRERSVEQKFLTPVFGTSCPPRGLSGIIRRYAYRYSEGRAAHWMILMAGDRVDAWEHHLRSFFTLRPDNPITETGVLSEFSRHGFRSRVGQRRADLSHQPFDPLIVAGPWVAAAAIGGYLTYKSIRALTEGSSSVSEPVVTASAEPSTDTNGGRGAESRRPRWGRLRTLFSSERTSGSSLLSSVSPAEVGQYVIGHLPLGRFRQ